MYVVLRDVGTIFHDGSQDKSVTGIVPTKLKDTPKVKAAVKAGILVKVEDAVAEAAIAKAEGKAKAIKASSVDHSAKVAELETEIGELTAANAEKDTQIAELTTAKEAAEAALEGGAPNAEAAAAKDTEIAALTARAEKAEADLKAKSDAYETVKGELAKATAKK